ncbi:mechanosensitive ion channel family protein [Membranihabitans maritimus]|uniref:mechanosensitive ion channel family protein n=1 Tax=Membranihabitans maritimus TaxID=2904244 RepID=UPI001F02948E|nr:mechanosensitive ion channel domain-containing protein [Membranihabitans maritimus]
MEESLVNESQFYFLDMMSQFLQTIAEVLPNILAAILIVIFGYILARILSRFLTKVIIKLGLDKQAEKLNSIDIFQSINIKIKPSAILGKFLYYMIMLFVLIAAADIINMPTITRIIRDIVNLIPQLLTALFILLIGIFLSDGLRKLVQTTCESLGIPSSKLISAFVFYFLIVNILLTALEQAGIETQSLSQNISLLIGGLIFAFAIGYGLASKDIFANILNSFYNRELFQVGDYIRWNNYQGQIVDMDRSRLTLRMDDSESVIIPMNKLAKEEIVLIYPSGESNEEL